MAKTSKKIKLNSLLIVLAILVVLIIAIVAIIRMNQNKSEEQNGNESNAQNTVSYVEEIEDGVKLNTSTAMNTSKTLNGLLISNIQLSSRSGMTNLLADVTNNNSTATTVKTVEITLLSEDGQELTKLTGIINAMQPGETTELNISTTSNYVEAYDFTITEK